VKKLEDYHWICPEPFTNVMHAVSGNIKPCCAFHADDETLRKHKWKKYHSKSDSFTDFYNSDQMKRLRKAMKDGGDDEFLNDMCCVCKEQEKSSNRSHRQFYISRFNDDFANRKEELETIIANDSQPTFYHSAELNGIRGNICNLSCNMCSSGSSSMYNKEAINLGEETIRIMEKEPEVSKIFLDDLTNILQNTDEIKFTGGEPLIGDSIYNILDKVTNKQDKRLRVITNGTQDAEKFITKTKDFKRVVINVSVEAVGKLNDYIRYPSTFSVIDQNIKSFIAAPHIETYISSTIGALNVGNIHEMCQYYGDKFIAGSYIVNNSYNIASIPDDIKHLYLDRLYSYGRYKEVKKVIKYLESIEHNQNMMWELLKHVKRRDVYRKTCLLDVLPEWKKYYENCSS
jgi:MoaA/NifB/PqqE/SkfB family radical SAM enzyme